MSSIPRPLDARNSGTMASMCGLEEAIVEKDRYKLELSVKRILLLNSVYHFLYRDSSALQRR